MKAIIYIVLWTWWTSFTQHRSHRPAYFLSANADEINADFIKDLGYDNKTSPGAEISWLYQDVSYKNDSVLCFPTTDFIQTGNSSKDVHKVLYPVLKLQGTFGRMKLLPRVLLMIQNITDKDVKVLSDTLTAFLSNTLAISQHGELPNFLVLLKLVKHVFATAPTNQTTYVISQLHDLINSSHEFYELVHLLTSSKGEELLHVIFEKTQADKIANFMTLISTLMEASELNLGNATTQRLSAFIHHNMTCPAAKPLIPNSSPQLLAASKFDLGQRCGHSMCVDKRSACLQDRPGFSRCICLPGYLTSLTGECKKAPTKLFTRDNGEFNITADTNPGDSVGIFSRVSLSSTTRSPSNMTIEIFPPDAGVAAVITADDVTITLLCSPRDLQPNVLLHVNLSIEQSVIYQIIPVFIHIREVTKLQTILLDGSLNGTRVSSITSHGERPYMANFVITNSYPPNLAEILFSVKRNGDIFLKKEINLLELSASSVSFEIFFEIRSMFHYVQNSTHAADVSVLIIQKYSNISLPENSVNIPILYHMLRSKSNFAVTVQDTRFQYKNNTVMLRKRFDYENCFERNVFFTYKVMTNDKTLKTTCSVLLKTNDINDEPPTFTQTEQLVTVSECTPQGVVAGFIPVADPDTPISNVTFTIHGPASHFFTIGTNGELITKVAIGGHTSSSLSNIIVSASDGIHQSLQQLQITFKVIRCSTRFVSVNKTFIASIKENRPPINVTCISVHDETLRNYRFQEHQDAFTINASSGVVYTTKSLDRENATESLTKLTVLAEEASTCRMVKVGTLYVHLSDVNDNPPLFSSKTYRVNVSEDAPVKSLLLTTSVTDPDIDDSKAAQFFLLPTSLSSYFVLSSKRNTVQLRLRKALDREEIPEFNMTLCAVDKGPKPLSSCSSVHIHVKDVNDNSPRFVFGQNVTLWQQSVNENQVSHRILTVQAVDNDFGNNGTVRFLIRKGGLGFFKIEPESGELKTTGPLDTETKRNFTLFIEAYDLGSPQRSVTKQLIIVVNNSNDNYPDITNKHKMSPVIPLRNACLSPIYNVTAFDKDGDDITFTMKSELFAIGRHSGVITCKSRMAQGLTGRHSLTIIVSDNGKPALHSSAVISLDIINETRNIPLFTQSRFYAHVNTSTWVPNKPVVILDTVNKGLRIHDFGLRVVPSNCSHCYHVTSNVVYLTCQKPPSSMSCNFNVTVSGYPSKLSPLVTVTLTISQNGHSLLTFGTTRINYNFTVVANRSNYEYKPLGLLKGCGLLARRARLVYAIADDPTGSFKVNRRTGALYYKGAFHLQDWAYKKLIVNATLGNLSDSCLVTVKVHRPNTPPAFVLPVANMQYTLREDAEVDTVVADLKARSVNEEALVYNVSSNTDFKINTETGMLTVARTLDADGGKQKYSLLVTASTKGTYSSSTTAVVNITLLDVNDNGPVFTQATYNFNILENSFLYEKVTGPIPLTATDRDVSKSSNGHVTYWWKMKPTSRRDTCPFNLTEDGSILVAHHLDYETTQRYSCIVTAHDQPLKGKPQNATASVNIRVKDANDNPPRFIRAPYNVKVRRNAAVGDLVTDLVRAEDEDTENCSGLVLYSLRNCSHLSIETATGRISVAKPLHDIPSPVIAVIEAIDQPQHFPALTSSTAITVNIFGNKPGPRFNKSVYQCAVKEEMIPALPVVQVVAVDGEPGAEHRCDCTYRLAKSGLSSFFTINNNTGFIKQILAVDREEVGPSITLRVTAVDRHSPSRHSTVNVVVVVEDENDNAPYIDEPVQTFSVPQDAAVGHMIGQLSYIDPDDPQNSTPDFRTILPHDSICVNQTGAIFVTSSLPLPLSQNDSIMMVAIVLDGASMTEPGAHINTFQPENATVQLVIHVIRSDLPFIQFTQDVFVTNMSGSSRGDHVFTPEIRGNVSDVHDSGITFEIISGNVRDIFQVNGSSGIVYLQYDLDETIPSTLTITLSIQNQVQIEISSCQLKVFITNRPRRHHSSSPSFEIYIGLLTALSIVTLISLLVSGFLYKKLRVTWQLVNMLSCNNTVVEASGGDIDSLRRYAKPVTYIKSPYTELAAENAFASPVQNIDVTDVSVSADQTSRQFDPDRDYESLNEYEEEFDDKLHRGRL